MATRATLKNIARARIKTAKILIEARDWDGAAQMLGLALECALKAVICKTLCVDPYPENHPNDKKVREFFMTHSFDRLLIISGLSEMFSAAGESEVFANWSDFTFEYNGEWTAMRYNDPRASTFSETKVKMLYESLVSDESSIINAITKKRKW